MRILASTLPAAARASLAAGPIFLATGLFFVWFEDVAGTPAPLDPALLAIFPFMLITVPFGIILAIIPNALGTAALGWLGSDNVGLRYAPTWALAGAAATGIPLMLCGNVHDPVTHALIATGAISALLCRARTRWPD